MKKMINLLLSNIKEYIIKLLLIIIAFTFIFPMIFTLANSFMKESEIRQYYTIESKNVETKEVIENKFTNIRLIPQEVTLEQYIKILIKQPQYIYMFWNSLIIVLPITFGQIFIALLAAYGFFMSNNKFKEYIFFIYIIVMLMPYQVTLVPNYIIAEKLNLIDNYLSIILPGIFNTYGVFLLRQYMKYIPKSYIEAAQIDGANIWEILWRIVAPLTKSAVASLAILIFIDNWNMVEQPLILLKETYKQPLSIFLSQINKNEKGIAFAASVFYMIPMLLVFLYCQNYLIDGIQHTGIKG